MPPRRLKTADVPDLLKPGMRVFVQGGICEPAPLVEALAAAPEAARGVEFVMGIVPGVNGFDYAGLDPEARLTTNFVTQPFRKSFAEHRLRFLPLHYSAYFEYLAALDFDLAFLQLAPADTVGRHSIGPATDFPPAVLKRTKALVGFVNPHLPAISDGPSVAHRQLAAVIDAPAPLRSFPAEALDPVSVEIGRQVAELIADGDTIQIGIGKLPSAILAQLSGHRDLGFHTGLITDAVIDLIESGVANGRRKSLDRSLCVTGLAVGTQRLYDALTQAQVSFRPANYTHGAATLARIERFVSINAAVEIDLFGQCNAESLDGRQISGTGGFADFMRAARIGVGGRSIVALPATAGGGRVTRIRSTLAAGAAATGLRADIDFVVTEHGVASLRHASLDERAAALISVAAPAFREDLSREWSALRSRL